MIHYRYSSIIVYYRVFSLTWATSMQIYWNKRKRLHKKRVQLPEDWSGTPTWPPFHCFGTPIWLPWSHVKTLCYRDPWKIDDLVIHNQAKCRISSASIAALGFCHGCIANTLYQIMLRQPCCLHLTFSFFLEIWNSLGFWKRKIN